jgi:3-methyladenine DNA glycosylase AlkD
MTTSKKAVKSAKKAAAPKKVAAKNSPKAVSQKGKTPENSKAEALTAKNFLEALELLVSEAELQKIQRYFKSGEGQYGEGDLFIGVRMGEVFALAKAYSQMPLKEIEKLLESNIHEARAGAVSIMDFQARDKKTPEARKKELFDLYIRRHDRINNWDLVDRSAQYVVGAWLFDKPRAILTKLAKSKNVWERRTAIVATSYFIRQRQLDDTFKIADMLVGDKQDLIHKAAGGWIREAGKQDKQMLLAFLDKHAATMPRTMLRYAIEHLDSTLKKKYMDK